MRKEYCDRCNEEIEGDKTLWTFYWFKDNSHLEFCSKYQKAFRRFMRRKK